MLNAGPSRTATAESNTVEGWRRTILERGLWTAAGVIGFAMLATLGRSPGIRLLCLLLPGFTIVVGTLAWRKGSTRARTTCLVFGFFLAMFGASLDRGFLLPNVIAAGVMICVLSATVAGRRGAWLAVVVAGCAWTLTGTLFVSGMAVPQDDFVDLSVAANWLRVLCIYMVILIAAVSSVVFMVSRLEAALRQTEALSDAVAREAEQKLLALRQQQDLQDKLYRSQKLESLGRLAGGIAHDFNNVLHVITANIELANGAEVGTDERASNLRAAQEAGHRASVLVRQLLAFTRHGELERGYIDVGPRVSESIEMVRRLIPDSVTLHANLDDVDSGCWAPPTAIEQILVNLAVNACQAMPDGGELHVRLTTQSNPHRGGDEFILLSVRDTGCGMSEELQQRAFEPFFTTKDPANGTGLGLSLVLALAEQTGGTAKVRSTEGEGTTVEVWLRPGRPQDAPIASPRSLASEVELSGTVLLVDDDDDVRLAVSTVLRRAGLDVLEAEDGQAALDLFEQKGDGIDVVVTDAVMPRMGGEELVEKISAQAPEVPCLVCSGYAADMFSERFFSSPLRAFLAKPFSNRELLTMLAALLNDGNVAAPLPPADGHTRCPDSPR